jgi:hypothetical protein
MAQKKKTAREGTERRTATKRTWVVTTSNERPIAEIAKDLAAAGFSVDQTLEQIGVITGKSDDKAIGRARAVRGVTDVAPEVQVDIGPPNSRDTW